MAKKQGRSVVGAWAFLIGVILALVLGLFGLDASWVTTVLVVLGLIVGLLNVGVGAEVKTFLFAAVSLVIVGSFGGEFLPGKVGEVLNALMVLFVPATVVVALKSVFSVANA